MSPTVTTDLLAIELKTLGIAVTPAMRWTVRCHGLQATVEMHEGSDSSGPVTNAVASGAADRFAGTVSAEVDLSTTDEAAWPRLIAISASELVEQQKRSASLAPAAVSSPARESVVRLQLVAWDVKTKKKNETYLPALGLSVARAGDPGTNLVGMTLGVDRRIGANGLIGLGVRGQWGKTSLGDVNVNWRVISAAVGGGATLNIGLFDVDAMAGFRLGRLTLTGETTAADASGRSLVGTTAGPFVALRLRKSLGARWFFGVALEEGYCLTSMRGNDDGVAPLLTVEGLWSNATLSVGLKL